MGRHKRSHCPRGHAMVGDNVRIYPKRPHDRHCRACDLERKREVRKVARLRIAPPPPVLPKPTHRRRADGGIGGRAEQEAIDRMLQRQQQRRAA